MKEKDINQVIVKALYKSRYTILLVTTIFFIAALVITKFIPKKYAAYGVVYPTASNVMTEVEKNPDFGYDIHADRLIQLFQSDFVKNKIVEEFNLIEYYKLDTNKPGWRFSLNKNFANDIKYNRTRYLSVAIQANMRDPLMAANIVNRSINLIDSVRKKIFQKNSQILLKKYHEKFNKQEEKVDNLLSKIFSTKNSTQKPNSVLSKNRLNQLTKRNEDGDITIGDDLVRDVLMSNYSIKKEKLLNDYYHEVGVYNSIRDKYSELKNRMDLPFPGVYKIIQAEADEKKVSPSYFINGLIGLILGLVFAITWVVGKTRYKQVIDKVKA